MSTQIKRIEKEYFLSKLAGEQIPVVYMYNRKDYILKVDKITKDEIEFVMREPVEGLLVNKRINLMFNYKGLIISFTAEIKSIIENIITTAIPEVLYKNLERSNQRVAIPSDMRVEVLSLEDRYSLPFPKSTSFVKLDPLATVSGIDPKDFNTLVARILQDLKPFADGYKIVYYNTSVQPEKPEERLVAECGKILYIPSTKDKFTDVPNDTFISTDVFKRYYETVGVGSAFLEQTIDQFLKSKLAEDLLSVMWVPFLFQEYVVGYIYAWRNAPKNPDDPPSKKPFTEELASKVYQYGKCIVYSLEQRGYFEAGRLKDRVINGRVADISASGLRFAVPNSFVFLTLQPGVELGVTLIMPSKIIKAQMKIRRRYKEGTLVYLGCSFLDITPADAEYLFTFIYGEPSNEVTETLFTGNV
jgi:c-di-GMP-binding flagellar brake protein YcgR